MTVPPGDEEVDQDAIATEADAQTPGEEGDNDSQEDLANEWDSMVGDEEGASAQLRVCFMAK